jgi:PAS domain-containing protein
MTAPQRSPDSGPFGHAHPEVQSQKYVVFADTNRRYIDCSNEVCGLLGYSKTEILTKTIDDLSYFSSAVPDVFSRFLQNLALDGQYLLRHKSGRPISIRYQAWTFADGCLAAVWEPVEKWQQFYYEALLEFEPENLRVACDLALAEIERRSLECETEGSATSESSNAMAQAAAALHLLRDQK